MYNHGLLPVYSVHSWSIPCTVYIYGLLPVQCTFMVSSLYSVHSWSIPCKCTFIVSSLYSIQSWSPPCTVYIHGLLPVQCTFTPCTVYIHGLLPVHCTFIGLLPVHCTFMVNKLSPAYIGRVLLVFLPLTSTIHDLVYK